MKHSTGKPTKDDLARWALIRDKGCVCCIKKGVLQWHPVEIHHLLLAGKKRRGHRFTIGLCSLHHRNVRSTDYPEELRWLFGPSLPAGSRIFHEAFGTDDELLAYQDELIGWTDPPKAKPRKKHTSPKIITHTGVVHR